MLKSYKWVGWDGNLCKAPLLRHVILWVTGPNQALKFALLICDKCNNRVSPIAGKCEAKGFSLAPHLSCCQCRHQIFLHRAKRQIGLSGESGYSKYSSCWLVATALGRWLWMKLDQVVQRLQGSNCSLARVKTMRMSPFCWKSGTASSLPSADGLRQCHCIPGAVWREAFLVQPRIVLVKWAASNKTVPAWFPPNPGSLPPQAT